MDFDVSAACECSPAHAAHLPSVHGPEGCRACRPGACKEYRRRGALPGAGHDPGPEGLLASQIGASEIVPVAEVQYRFHTARKWALDFAWPASWVTLDETGEFPVVHPLALEIEGMDHRRPQRYATDLKKYNALSLLGWTLVRFTPKEVTTRIAIETLEAIFSGTDLLEWTARKA